MESYFTNFLWFGIFFILVFVVYFFLLRFKMKRKKYNSIGEISYLVHKFRLDTKRLNYWSLILPISLINAFIISFVATFVLVLSIAMIWQLFIGFVLLISLIYSLYEIYGRHLAKKYGKG